MAQNSPAPRARSELTRSPRKQVPRSPEGARDLLSYVKRGREGRAREFYSSAASSATVTSMVRSTNSMIARGAASPRRGLPSFRTRQ
jgi:hypothetical protein